MKPDKNILTIRNIFARKRFHIIIHKTESRVDSADKRRFSKFSTVNCFPSGYFFHLYRCSVERSFVFVANHAAKFTRGYREKFGTDVGNFRGDVTFASCHESRQIAS